MVDPVEQCSACRQKLWSAVTYCPFCGVQAAADADKPAQAEAAAVPPPLPKTAPTPAAPTPAAPAAISKEAMQAALRKAASEVAEPKKPAKPKQPRPAPEVPPVPPQPKEQPAAPAVPPPPPSIAGKKWLLGLAAACILVYFFWSPKPSGPDACDQSLAQAQSAMQQENAQEARKHSQAAIDSCKDKQRALLAKTTDNGAQALLKTQLQAMARAEQQSRQLAQAQQESQQRTACDGANRLTANLLRTAQLNSARQNLQRMDPACRQMGETQALSAQLDGMQATANKATADASAQLADGALGQARTSIDVLANANRESAELPELRAALIKALASSADAAARPAPAAPPAPVVQTELLRSFIRDAEASMQQRLYDKAKTYAESAQRIDPRNPEVTRLLRRIKEHEMSYLRDRIVIE